MPNETLKCTWKCNFIQSPYRRYYSAFVLRLIPCILLVCTLFFALHLVDRTRSYAVEYSVNSIPGATFGEGIDGKTSQARGQCVEISKPLAVAAVEGQAIHAVVVEISEREALLGHAGISSAANLKLFSVEAGFDYNASKGLAIHQYSHFMLVLASIQNNFMSVVSPKFKPEILELLKQPGEDAKKRFHQQCGTEYVHSILTGGSLLILIEIMDSQSSQEKQQAGGGHFRYMGAGGSLKGFQDLTKVIGDKQYTVTFIQAGGAGKDLELNISKLQTYIEEFPGVVLDKGGRPIKLITRDYSVLSRPEDTQLLKIDYERDVVDRLSKLINETLDVYTNISFVLANQGEFEAVDGSYLSSMKDELEKVLSILKAAALDCQSFDRPCKVPEVVLPYVRLPERGKKSPDHGIIQHCSRCPEMVVVPAGEFMMGSPEQEEGRGEDESPRHQVRFGKDFAVGRYEITFEEWDACVAEGKCGALEVDKWNGPRDRWPVVTVKWTDAKKYVEWLSEKTGQRYRLLSEAEWEYVARAGVESPRYWGNDWAISCRYENLPDISMFYEHDLAIDSELMGKFDLHGYGAFEFYFYDNETGYVLNETKRKCYDGFHLTAPVGMFSPNAFGLHDMLGNVQEWVEDCWHKNYVRAPVDGSAWSEGEHCDFRVIRGVEIYYPGGLYYPDIGIDHVRVANRWYKHIDGHGRFYWTQNPLVGFRIALDME